MTYRFEMMGRPFKFTAEAYYKALSHLVPYSVDNVKVTYYGENTASGHATGSRPQALLVSSFRVLTHG